MGRDRIAVIVAFLICVVLASSLVGMVIYYSGAVAEKDLEIRKNVEKRYPELGGEIVFR